MANTNCSVGDVCELGLLLLILATPLLVITPAILWAFRKGNNMMDFERRAQLDAPVPKRYVEILGVDWQHTGTLSEPGVAFRYELSDKELRSIGRFTRKNVAEWLWSHDGDEWIGILRARDFHAICYDIDIPWSDKESPDLFVKVAREMEERISRRK